MVKLTFSSPVCMTMSCSQLNASSAVGLRRGKAKAKASQDRTRQGKTRQDKARQEKAREGASTKEGTSGYTQVGRIKQSARLDKQQPVRQDQRSKASTCEREGTATSSSSEMTTSATRWFVHLQVLASTVSWQTSIFVHDYFTAHLSPGSAKRHWLCNRENDGG